MRKYILIGALIAATFLTGYDSCPDPQPPMPKMYATAYCLQGKTYTGKKVRKGIAATGDKDLIGKTVIILQCLPDGSAGKQLGIYEIEDYGCKVNVLDIWCEDMESCQEFMDSVYEDGCQGKVYCRFIDAKG